MADTVVKDPIRDFLFDVADTDKAYYVSALKVLFVLKVDMDHSGHEAILLSLGGYGGKGGNIWEVYLPAKDGYKKVLPGGDDPLYFRGDMFYVGYVERVKQYGLLAFSPAQEGGELRFFRIVDGVIKVEKIGEVHAGNQKDRMEMEKYFGKRDENRSQREHPVTRLGIDDLKKLGYDVDAAVRAAAAR